MAREQVSYMLICPGCGLMGLITWDEPTDERVRISDRELVDLVSGFHVETSGFRGNKMAIVCDHCDTTQPD